ncbi:MAG TPA: hypothetical protein VIK72_09430 [Clostridiaceae bacterium]
MKELLCNLAIKVLIKYNRSVILNYQIRGDIRPIYNIPILGGHMHIIGKSYINDIDKQFIDYRRREV